jgi:hypothetical protein
MTREESKKAETPEIAEKAGVMSVMDFARLGDGHIAYVRQIDTGEAVRLFPALKGIPEGIDLYALVSADGTPLSLRDSRNSAIADAMEHDLETVSVH